MTVQNRRFSAAVFSAIPVIVAWANWDNRREQCDSGDRGESAQLAL
jgi:hypothetical protein